MMTDNDLEKLRDQGPTPEIPPIHTIVRRASELNGRARWQRLTAVAAIAAVIVGVVVAEPWNGQTHHGVAGADVLAAVGANLCGGNSRRSTPAEADAVRFLPAYVPSGFTIGDAFANHETDFACFRFFPRVVYTKRTGPDTVSATLTISTGSEPAARVDCGPRNAPTPVDAPSSDFQRCVHVRGRTGALVHLLDTTYLTWIEPDVGAVSVEATALTPETVVELANGLTTPGNGTITVPAAAVPTGYSLAYENWDRFSALSTHDDFRATFVRGHGPVNNAPELWISVSPTRRTLWALFPGLGSFDLVHVQGHDGFVYETDGGVSVNWKVGDNLFSVNTPRGITREEALRVARSFAPVARDDARLIDPYAHN